MLKIYFIPAERPSLNMTEFPFKRYNTLFGEIIKSFDKIY